MESLCPRLLVRNTKKKISAAEVSKQPRLNINNRRAWGVGRGAADPGTEGESASVLRQVKL